MINRTLLTGICSAALATFALAGSLPQSSLSAVVETASSIEAPALPVTPGDRGVIGVTLSEEGGSPEILEIFDGSPAQKSGLKSGDKIVSIDGKKIPSLEALVEVLGKRQAGDKVKVGIERDGWRKDVKLVLASPESIEKFDEEKLEIEKAAVIEKAHAEKVKALKKADAEKAKAAKAARAKKAQAAKDKKAQAAKAKKAKAAKAKKEAAAKKKAKAKEKAEAKKATKRSTLAVKVQSPAKATLVTKPCDSAKACDSAPSCGAVATCDSAPSCGSAKVDQKVIEQLSALGYVGSADAPSCSGGATTPCAEGCACVGDTEKKVVCKTIAIGGGGGCELMDLGIDAKALGIAGGQVIELEEIDFECDGTAQVFTTGDGQQVRCEVRVLGGDGECQVIDLTQGCEDAGSESCESVRTITKTITLGGGDACCEEIEVECDVAGPASCGGGGGGGGCSGDVQKKAARKVIKLGGGDACCEEAQAGCGGAQAAPSCGGGGGGCSGDVQKNVTRKVIKLGGTGGDFMFVGDRGGCGSDCGSECGSDCGSKCEVECDVKCEGEAKFDIHRNEVFQFSADEFGGKDGQFWVTGDDGHKAMIVFEGLAELDDLEGLHAIHGLKGLEGLEGLEMLHHGIGGEKDGPHAIRFGWVGGDDCCGECDDCDGDCDDCDGCEGECEVENDYSLDRTKPRGAIRLRRPVDTDVRRPDVSRIVQRVRGGERDFWTQRPHPEHDAHDDPHAELDALRQELAALRAEIRELRQMLKQMHGHD